MLYQQKSTRLNEADWEKPWYVVDASGQVLGRMATRIARTLMGKDNPRYTPNVDSGAYVVVINADKVVLTGDKMNKKVYRRFSRYPGHMKEIYAREMHEKKPEKIVELAVKRMLPKNRLGRKMFKKLKVYASPEHPHQAQNPREMEL
ncbi:MAG TPA: 50S ribosomal protein L13 [Thermotogota bacterium]|nr:50S ribosomal protein L13 [Thermotogota bacterium]HRW91912.1 50S ribosomal protein L13 [Thermotogota bacterium]